MQTIQELLTRGLDLDFNALGEILRVEIAAESILAFCAVVFSPRLRAGFRLVVGCSEQRPGGISRKSC